MAGGVPYSHTFTYKGHVVTVAMTEPQTPDDVGIPVGLGAVFPGGNSAPTDRVTEQVAYLCPAQFRVDGLPYRLTFRTSPTDPDRRSPADPIVCIAALTVELDQVTTDDVTIPTRRLLAAALKASQVWGLVIPPRWRPDFDGSAMSIFPNPHDSPAFITGGSTAARNRLGQMQEVPGVQAAVEGDLIDVRRRNRVTREVLQLVADTYRNAPHGRKHDDVAAAVGVGSDRAKQLIAEARKAGFLENPPDTDKRTHRRKSSQ